jgi:hypothetical protein
MANQNEDIEASKFRDKICKRPGEWDFADFYSRAPQKAVDKSVVLMNSINSIVDGTHNEARLKHVRELVGSYIASHEGTLTEYAQALTSRRNTDKGYTDSPIMGKEKYHQFMDEYINALKGAVVDFKIISDANNTHRASESLKAWTQDAALYKKLDEALRRANDTNHKNDLRITDSKLAEKIQLAYTGLSSISEALGELGRQSGQANSL